VWVVQEAAVPNLVKLKFGFLFNGTDVAHCEAMPQICPAEHLAMEICENSSFRLQPQTSISTDQNTESTQLANCQC